MASDTTLLPQRLPSHRSSGTPANLARVAVVIAACLFISYLVVNETRAAFSGTTANSANSFDAGTVSITDDDSGSAMFSVSGMTPGDSALGCILVTYTGSISADVKLYASATTTDLAQYLNLTVEEGEWSGGTNCATNFVADATIFTPGTIGSFLSTHTGWANGLAANASTWAQSDDKVYRFTATLQDNNSAQGLSVAGLAFTWEAQNE